MPDWLGIDHLTDYTTAEAVWAFFTPLIIMAIFAALQVILPTRHVKGYVKNEKTGEPLDYRLNGLLVFVIVQLAWIFEITGLSHDWFYRSTLWAVAGGTSFTAIFAVWSVYTQPPLEGHSKFDTFFSGRAQELRVFGGRLDIKMWFYVVGGTMLSINSLSGAVWHYNNVNNPNPGVYLFAGFWTFYVLDYFIFEHVNLYTYDLLHERIGFKLWWGGIVIYGWMFPMPLWGTATLDKPDISDGLTYVWLISLGLLLLCGWIMERGGANQKHSFKLDPERRWMGIKPEYIEAGERKILVNGFWGVSRHLTYTGAGINSIALALALGHPGNLWSWTFVAFSFVYIVHRQRDDDRQCAKKYGTEAWTQYQAQVPYRLIPKIY